MTTKTTAVIGAGYVGLSTTAMLIEFGWNVRVIEVNPDRVAMLNAGEMPILEPGLEELFNRGRSESRLAFGLPETGWLAECDIVFVCVGTPMWHTGDANLSQIEAAVDMIAEFNPDAIVVIKSTVPPGTNAMLRQRSPELRFISNPEFLRQGTAVSDTLNPDRVVVGGHDPEAIATITELYEPLAQRGIPVVQTTPASAELIKYAANSLLGIKVAFINEIADLAETVGADITEISHAIGLDPRIGDRFLTAGPGFGGSCFPKDTAALVATAERLGSPVTIVDAAARANRRRRESLAHRVVSVVGGKYEDARVGVLGLTFKAGTDDVRESPAVDLVNELVDNGVTVVAFDPAAPRNSPQIRDAVRIVDDPYEVARDADAVVVATEWPEFKALDLNKIAELMRGSDVVDLRNILDATQVSAAHLTMHPVGKPITSPAIS
jgi:UDPglucose 6-dehydrogenase